MFQSGRSFVEYDLVTGARGVPVPLEGLSKEIGRTPVTSWMSQDGKTMLGLLASDPEDDKYSAALVWSTDTGRVLKRLRISDLSSFQESTCTPDLAILAICAKNGIACY